MVLDFGDLKKIVKDEIVDVVGAVGGGASGRMAVICTKGLMGCGINSKAIRGCEAVLCISIKHITLPGRADQLEHSVQSVQKNDKK